MITISDSYLKTATSLSIARSMIHESTHAYIIYNNTGANSTFQESIEEFGRANGYDIISDPNRFHHEFMSQYINAMAYSLFEWDKEYGTGKAMLNSEPKDLLGWDYYYSMAFGGLFYTDIDGNQVETDSFIELVPDLDNRQKIKNILINEQNGNTDAKGEKCN